MNKITLILFFFTMLPVQLFNAQEMTENIKAKISHKEHNGFVFIENNAINESEIHSELEYLFISIKKNKQGNISSNKQSGKFSLSPKSTKKLSETTVNLGQDDELKCYLYLKDETTKTLISKDSLLVNVKKKS